MAIRFYCPNCAQMLGISSRKAGAAVVCPRCGGGVGVPAPRGEVVLTARRLALLAVVVVALAGWRSRRGSWSGRCSSADEPRSPWPRRGSRDTASSGPGKPPPGPGNCRQGRPVAKVRIPTSPSGQEVGGSGMIFSGLTSLLETTVCRVAGPSTPPLRQKRVRLLVCALLFLSNLLGVASDGNATQRNATAIRFR